jgi:hypothetical protein
MRARAVHRVTPLGPGVPVAGPIDAAAAANMRYLDRWGHWARDEDEWQLGGPAGEWSPDR